MNAKNGFIMRHFFYLFFTLSVLLCPFSTASDNINTTISHAEMATLTEQVIEKLNSNYLYPHQATTLAKALNKKLATQWHSNSYLKDKFLHELRHTIKAATGDSQIVVKPIEPRTKLSTNLDETIITADVLEDNIGYLRIDGNLTLSYNEASIKKSLSFVKNTDGLILDLREAEELSIEYTQLILSYFYASGTHLATVKLKSNNIELESLDNNDNNTTKFSMPIIVITSAFTAGPWEYVAHSLQAADKAVIIGQDTMGINVFTQTTPINNHYEITLPFAKILGPNLEDYFNHGVLADHQSKASNLKVLALSLLVD